MTLHTSSLYTAKTHRPAALSLGFGAARKLGMKSTIAAVMAKTLPANVQITGLFQQGNSLLHSFSDADVYNQANLQTAITQIQKSKNFTEEILPLHKKNITGVGQTILIDEAKSPHRDTILAIVKTIAPNAKILIGNSMLVTVANQKIEHDISKVTDFYTFAKSFLLADIQAYQSMLAQAKTQGVNFVSLSNGSSYLTHAINLLDYLTYAYQKDDDTQWQNIVTTFKKQGITFDIEHSEKTDIARSVSLLLQKIADTDATVIAANKSLSTLLNQTGIALFQASPNNEKIVNGCNTEKLPAELLTIDLLRKTPQVICVGESDPNTHLMSPYTTPNSHIDVLEEPGVNQPSIHIGMSSYSTPYATAIATLAKQVKPTLSAAQLENLLKQSNREKDSSKPHDLNTKMLMSTLGVEY